VWAAVERSYRNQLDRAGLAAARDRTLPPPPDNGLALPPDNAAAPPPGAAP
jgi:hypothetical protein